jgi:XTP/dITP diphosphohydrolase
VSDLPTIVLASGNLGKIREIQAMLEGLQIAPQADFAVREADETAATFIENAIIKARHAARHCQLPSIADDSGLIVDALHGAPGVISARYAGVEASDQANVNKLLEALEGIPDPQRTARFICVMVYMRHADDPFPLIAQGMWEGCILPHCQGKNGFGYDPVFWLPEQGCTSAELPANVKNTLSHRGQALRQLVDALNWQTSQTS